MKKNNGLSWVALTVIIIALIGFAGVTCELILGDDGVVEKATKEEAKYNKSEVLEELNLVITENYLSSYKKATKEGKNNLEKFYNTEKVIKYLKGYSGGETGEDYSVQDSKVIIEDLVGTTDMYFVRVTELNKDITSFGKGENKQDSKDFFYIKKESEEVYKVYYRNSDLEDEEIGVLQFKPEV